MFTGIVERMGRVESVTETARGKRFVIATADLGEVATGASLSVNGVCLTAVEAGSDRVAVDVVPETLRRTNLGAMRAGSDVNLERPMPADGRFDGHIVQGHVDGVGTVAAITEEDGGVVMEVSIDEDLHRYVVEKGSIAVDGVSLTVAGLTEGGFTIALIPHTLAITTLGLRKEGDEVNLEVDVLAKYVERMLGK